MLGIQCMEAESGEEALRLYHGTEDDGSEGGGGGGGCGGGAGPAQWDVVLMDEHLSPDPSKLRGTQVIQLLRASGFVGLVVSCSGNCMESDRAQYYEAGADKIWPKPYPPPAKLRTDLEEWVEEVRHQRAPGAIV
jgi:CheY-like chemotaxis protein